MDTYYLIDFENVNRKGMKGSETLKDTDHVHLFFTENAKKIDLDIISGCGALEFKLHKVPAGDQSLDKHLASYLGYLLGTNAGQECHYVIIGNDKGYDDIIDFWKDACDARISRQLKIVETDSRDEQIEQKKEKQGKQAKPKKKSGASGAETIALAKKIRELLEPYYGENTIGDVTDIVVKHYGEERGKQSIHNELLSTYEDDTDAKNIYNLIKPLLKKEDLGDTKKTSKEAVVLGEKNQLNNDIQKTLSKAKVDGEIINYVASLVVKNADADNSRQLIYRAIISQYGQKQGLNIYNLIKKHL